MLERTDVHRPSEIIPEDYQFIAQEYLKVEDLGTALFLKAEREKIQAHMAQTGGRYSQHEHGGNCMVCGSVNAVYTLLFYHAKTNSYVRMGTECADKTYSGADFGMNQFRRNIEDARLNQRGKMKAKALLGDAGLSAAWELYVADVQDLYNSLGVQSLPYEEVTIRDMVSKLVRYGSISDNALGYLRILLGKIPERAQRNAEREAKRKAEKEAAAPCPTGRVKIEGIVLKVEERENPYDRFGGGVRTVMTVKANEGYVVWGSVPSGAVVEKDCKITFVATVTPSENDSKFGFAKRPILYMTKEEKAALKAAQNEGVAI